MLLIISIRGTQQPLAIWQIQYPLICAAAPVQSWWIGGVDCLTGRLTDWLTERTSVWHVMR